MKLILVQSPVASSDTRYRHPSEAKLAKDLSEARLNLTDLVTKFMDRILEFRTNDDVWVDVSESKQLGVFHSDGPLSSTVQIAVKEDGEMRPIESIELQELVSLFPHFKKLKQAVIANSFDLLGEMKSAIHAFREQVMDIAGDEE